MMGLGSSVSPQPSKLASGTYGSLNPDLECWCFRDTDQLKENCIKLIHWLAQEQWKSDQNSTEPNAHSTNLAN